MGNTITFRPTQKASTFISAYMTEHNITSRSKAVSELIESFKVAIVPDEFTGKLIDCPMRPYPLCDECDLCEGMKILAPVDSSVCKTCERYPCETWLNIASERRLSK